MVVRMRHTRSQTRQRRSHHALSERTLSACTHCGAMHLPHHMCLSCGWYKGRQVMDLEAEKEKRTQRLKQKRERISVVGASDAPLGPVVPGITKGMKPTEEIRAAKGAAAKRLKDESLSQATTGTE